MQRECEGAFREEERAIGTKAKERGTERGGDTERRRGGREREKERAGHSDGLKEGEGVGISLMHVLVV